MTNTRNEIIDTPRLLLRKFTLTDIDDMLRNWIADEDVQTRYGEPVYTTRQAVADLLQNKWLNQYRWGIMYKETGENIGHVSFCHVHEAENTAEVEYCIGKRFWGQGIVPEALSTFIPYAFTHTATTAIEAFHRAENPASGRVLQKSGLRRVDNILRFADREKAPDGCICYAIMKDS